MPYNLTTMQSIFCNNKEIIQIRCNGSMVYQKQSGPDYSEPFYVENISDADETLSIVKSNNSAPTLEIEYSTDRTTWQTLGTTSTTALTRTLAPGEKLYLRCDTDEGWGVSGTNGSSNRISGCSKVGGNIMSLIYGSSFTGSETTFKNSTFQTFRSLFDSDNVVEDAKDLLLPATTLVPNCYRSLFGNCTNLTTAPDLSATNLAENCYRYMFSGTRITVVPDLPATTLAKGCYYQMFKQSSITAAPALPATTLVNECYQQMFQGCTLLTTAPALPATTLADKCYYGMFYGCTSLTTAPALPATTATSNCYYQMFEDCTSLTTAPELPATTLATSCYQNMFRNCTSLSTAPALPAITLADSCYYCMFQSCTSLTTAPELPAITLVSKCYYQMFFSCRLINKIKCLATDIYASSMPTTFWLHDVSSTGTFTKAAGVTWPTGGSGIPEGWTVVEV